MRLHFFPCYSFKGLNSLSETQSPAHTAALQGAATHRIGTDRTVNPFGSLNQDNSSQHLQGLINL